MIRVALIDDGVSKKIAKRYSGITTLHLYVNTMGIMERDKQKILGTRISHADICFQIYARESINRNTELVSINIMDNKKSVGNINRLIIALEWCLKNRINLINLSIGTVDFWDFKLLEYVLKKLYKNNTIVVAAHSNANVFTYPASSYFAIGVRCDSTGVLGPNIYKFIEKGIFDKEIICTKYIEGQLVDKAFNSYAAPFITAQIQKGLQSGCENIQEVLAFIREKSSKSNLDMWKIRKPYVSKKIEIPIIAVTKSDSNSVSLIKKIKNQFVSEGYVSYAIIDANSIVDEQIFLLSTLLENCNNNILYVIAFMQHYTKADVLLLNIGRELTEELCRENIVDITIGNNEDKIDSFYNISYECIDDTKEIIKQIVDIMNYEK